MQMPMKIHYFPVELTGKEVVTIATIFALEVIIVTALNKKYSVEVNGETTEDGMLKGSLKLNSNLTEK